MARAESNQNISQRRQALPLAPREDQGEIMAPVDLVALPDPVVRWARVDQEDPGGPLSQSDVAWSSAPPALRGHLVGHLGPADPGDQEDLVVEAVRRLVALHFPHSTSRTFFSIKRCGRPRFKTKKP